MKRGILRLAVVAAACCLLGGCTVFGPLSPEPGEEPVTVVEHHDGLPDGAPMDLDDFPVVFWDSAAPDELALVTFGSSSCLSTPVSYGPDGPVLSISVKRAGAGVCSADMAAHTWVLETPGSHEPGGGVRVNGADVTVVDPSTTVSLEITPAPPREPPPGSLPIELLSTGTDDPDGRLRGRATSYVLWPEASATLTVVGLGSGSCRAVPVSFDGDNTDELDLWMEAPGRPEGCSADLAVTSSVIAVPSGYASADGVRLNGTWVNVLR